MTEEPVKHEFPWRLAAMGVASVALWGAIIVAIAHAIGS